MISGFLLGMFPLVTMLIMLDFISCLVWLRESQYLQPVIGLIGTVMTVSAGLWVIVEKDARRLLGYAVLFESGFALMAVSIQSEVSVQTLFLSLFPRLGSLVLLSLSLLIFFRAGIVPNLEGLRGMIQRFPLASLGLILAFFSIAGLPLLGGFSTKFALLEQLGQVNQSFAITSLLAMGVFLLAIVRLLWNITRPVFNGWEHHETPTQMVLIIIGLVVLVVMGIIPNLFENLFSIIIEDLPILQ